jgi:DNA-directed RNA polymerase specialized sigma24 family protein
VESVAVGASAPQPFAHPQLDATGAAYAKILRVSIVAGLTPTDAQDIAQDIWLWLLQTGQLSEATSLPWVGAVAVNYIRRYWRARMRRDSREKEAAATMHRGRDFDSTHFELLLSFDEIERALPDREGKLLNLVRLGATFAEAARALGIPRGSQDYYRKTLHAHLVDALGARREPCLASPPRF